MRQTRPSLGQSRGRGSNEQGRVRAFRAGSRVALALLALGLAASASAEPEPAEPPNYGHTGSYVGMGGLGVIDVSSSRFDDEVSGGGGVYGEANGRFASWIAAEVEVNYFHDTDDNDFVEKDQVLVELDDGIGYSAVKKAQAALDIAQANLRYTTHFYKRQKALYHAGQLAQNTFEKYTKEYKTAKAKVLQAQADFEIRQQEYDNLFVKAPEAGVIIAKKVNLGQMITSRFQATELRHRRPAGGRR